MSGWIKIRFTLRDEISLYVALGLLGAALRFYNLGEVPLSDSEIRTSLSALQMSRGVSGIGKIEHLPLSPLLHTLQVLTFWFSGYASTGLSRLWPAVSGSLVVYCPLIIRGRIGRGAALLAVLFIAVSPTLCYVSRNSSGITLALLSGCLIYAGWRLFDVRKARWGLTLAAIALGAGLSSGPQFVTILFFVVVLFLVRPGYFKYFWMGIRPHMWAMLFPVAATFLLSATVFLRYPVGLAAVGESWSYWFSHLLAGNGQTSVWLLPALIVANEPGTVLISLSGVYMMVRGRLPWMLPVLLLGLGLAFGVAFGDRGPGDLVWMAMPLCLLAGVVLSSGWKGAQVGSEMVVVLCEVGALLVLMGFTYSVVSGIAVGQEAGTATIVWDVIIQVAILAVLWSLTVLFFATTWSWAVSWRGAVTGFLIVTLGWSLHTWTLMVNGVSARGIDRWYSETPSYSQQLMLDTLEGVSLQAVGVAREVEIVVIGDTSERLRWLLREFPNVSWMRRHGIGVSSPVVISSVDGSVASPGARYLGQEFGYKLYRQELPTNVRDWVKYVLFGSGSARQSKLVLWVREDVYFATGVLD